MPKVSNICKGGWIRFLNIGVEHQFNHKNVLLTLAALVLFRGICSHDANKNDDGALHIESDNLLIGC